MSLVHINWNPGEKELRNFGIITVVATAAVSLLLYLAKGISIQWSFLPFVIGTVVFFISVVSARLTRMIYLALVISTMPIGVAVSFILMAAFYFLLITPLALFFRLVGRDLLHRKFDPASRTYWVRRQERQDLERYFSQF